MLTWPSDSPGKRTIRFFARESNRALTWNEVLGGWKDNAGFRASFTRVLATAPFEAFRWETPGVTASDLHTAFEFALIDSPELLTDPDASAFLEHFRHSDPVVSFRNLGGDAELLAPCPLAAESAYTHLAAFVRDAPDAQRHALWRETGLAMTRRLGARPVWLSTAGGGVAWLHVRLDDRPKYYVHQPYRAAAGTRSSF